MRDCVCVIKHDDISCSLLENFVPSSRRAPSGVVMKERDSQRRVPGIVAHKTWRTIGRVVRDNHFRDQRTLPLKRSEDVDDVLLLVIGRDADGYPAHASSGPKIYYEFCG